MVLVILQDGIFYHHETNLDRVTSLYASQLFKIYFRKKIMMLSRKRSIERLQQRVVEYENSFALREAKKLHLRYRSLRRKKAQDIPTCEEKEGHNIIVKYQRLKSKLRKLNNGEYQQESHQNSITCNTIDDRNLLNDPTDNPTRIPPLDSSNITSNGNNNNMAIEAGSFQTLPKDQSLHSFLNH